MDKNATLKNSHGIHGCTLCVVNFQLDVVGRSDVEWLFLVFIFHHSFMRLSMFCCFRFFLPVVTATST